MIYVHIPFCHSKCAYCDFYSTPDSRRMEDVCERILLEYSLRKDELGPAARTRTLYFGGGTPSILPPHLLTRLARGLYRPDETEEFTIEVNPEDVSPETVAHWRSEGVNRVSMGIQSFVDSELQAVGRRHSGADALRAIRLLRQGGITNLSCDLIYGLPGQTRESWRHSLERLLGEGPAHISAYCLSYEPGTMLTRRLEQGRIRATDDETIGDMYAYLCQSLRAEGYEHYEISNFALPGMRSKHNSSYWTGTPYLGLGPGAHSLDFRGVRRYNPPDIRRYTAAEGFPVATVDEEDDTDRLNDLLITALRTAEGLDLSRLTSDQAEKLMAKASPFMRGGMLDGDGGRVRITEEAWLTSDGILRELLF